MQTKHITTEFQHMSPAGAEVRLLMNNTHGGIAHCTLPADSITKTVRHKTVSEFWYVISGQGKIWRRQGDQELVTELTPGTTIDIPVGTDFQYRSHEDTDLVFMCITMPPWSGADEAEFVGCGRWMPQTAGCA